jgi:hypothetical protein
MDRTRYALVNKKTGLVENIVAYEEEHIVDIVPDFSAVANIGDTWNGTVFVKPAVPEPEPTAEDKPIHVIS